MEKYSEFVWVGGIRRAAKNISFKLGRRNLPGNFYYFIAAWEFEAIRRERRIKVLRELAANTIIRHFVNSE